MMQLIHMTATYSNAVLAAILPHVTDCAKQLDLPLPQPVTLEQVRRAGISPYKDFISAGIWMTNNFWFLFENGSVIGFRSPDDWFTMADEYWDHLERYVGKDNMTTNEVIELARGSFRKLGYEPKDFGVDTPPTQMKGPYDNPKLGHIPYCRVEWNSPPATSQEEFDRSYHIQFDVDMQTKKVVGMALSSKKFFRPNPVVNVVPETETEFQMKHPAKMFFRSNAPALFQPAKPIELPATNHMIIPSTNSTPPDVQKSD